MVADPTIGSANVNKPHVIETGTRSLFWPVRSTVPSSKSLTDPQWLVYFKPNALTRNSSDWTVKAMTFGNMSLNPNK